MGRVAVEILPPLARDEGGTAFRVKDDRILSQDARARIFDVKTASHRGSQSFWLGSRFSDSTCKFRGLRRACRDGTQACRPHAVRGRRTARYCRGSWDGGLRRGRCRGTRACRPRAGSSRRTARYSRGSWNSGFRRGRRCGARSAGGSLSRLKRGGFREGCRLRRAYEFRGLRGGFLRVFSHGR